MIVDREKAKATFAAYVENYNSKDSKVKLKIDHTYRVADFCARIAESLELEEREVDLAWIVGLLHDVGRFEQLRQYGTFNDAKSIDHANFGADILFKEGLIRSYLVDTSEDVRIEKAIRCHSAYRIPEDYDTETKLLSEILRDADKIDILRVNVETPMEEIYNVSTEELKQAEVTKEVMEAFFEEHAVLRSLKKTAIDNLVGHTALVYELVFPISRKMVEEQGYLDILLGFESKNPKTREQFKILNTKMRQFLAR